ncbi:MAG TPA: AAA family ATPase [Pirellulaceae bacterium]|nr:AAA family ATPase [Pirellulaceae bacterium]
MDNLSFASAVADGSSATVVLPQSARPDAHHDAFLPREPQTLDESGLSSTDIESLILKHLLICGQATGRKIADQVKLPFGITQELLRGLKQQLLVNYKSQAAMGDFDHELTTEGETKARWYIERCTYCGAAPVPLKDYIVSIEKQSVRRNRPKLADLCAAYSDLTLSPAIISTIGQAIHTGRGMFIYGPPGNGKTSIAERVIRAAQQYIWVPRTVVITGETIRLFDPASHEEAPPTSSGHLLEMARYDRRWVRIKRPSIIVGGELKLEHLEFASHNATGIIEAPLQLKANGGALVVDDFGRQRVSPDELLNRWIVPLEKGHDYLTLPSGRQIQVPFDPILVFSTNIEPRKLVDEAFLRRMPYKVEIPDPTPREFRELIKQWCTRQEIEYRDDAVDHLLSKHYTEAKRPMRFCHPRDLLLQVTTFFEFHELPKVLSSKAFDVAVKNYFAGL